MCPTDSNEDDELELVKRCIGNVMNAYSRREITREEMSEAIVSILGDRKMDHIVDAMMADADRRLIDEVVAAVKSMGDVNVDEYMHVLSDNFEEVLDQLGKSREHKSSLRQIMCRIFAEHGYDGTAFLKDYK